MYLWRKRTFALNINRGELVTPTTLARTSQTLQGHCCEAPQSQQGILGNGMQHDAVLTPLTSPVSPRVSGFLALQQLRQAVFELGGKRVERRARLPLGQPQLIHLLCPAKPRQCNYLVNLALSWETNFQNVRPAQTKQWLPS